MIRNTACSVASPKLKTGNVPGKGRAVFCAEPIAAGEFVALIGGATLPLAKALQFTEEQRAQCIQVEDEIVLWISGYAESTADWINHSCDPNVGMSGQITLVAMRDIAEGEEICFDYAMCDGSPIDEFDCSCGAAGCRGRVTGADWRLPALQKRYRGFFSAYIARRIAKLP
jgi:uncharacterized protein